MAETLRKQTKAEHFGMCLGQFALEAFVWLRGRIVTKERHERGQQSSIPK